MMWMQTGKTIPSTSFLSHDDWSRINYDLKRSSFEEAHYAKERQFREHLHQRSKEMVEKWPNTLINLRKKKLEAHKQRVEKEENVRKKIDEEYAKTKAAERRKAISKAYRDIYWQTDKVKTLHSAYKLSEAVKERQSQMELKRTIVNWEKNKEREDAKLTWADVEKHHMEEKRRQLNIQEKNITHSKELNDQILQNNEKRQTENRAEMEEAQQIKEDVEKWKKIEDDKKQSQKKLALQWVEDYHKDLELRKQQQQIEEENIKRENEKIKVFADSKAAIRRKMKEREIEIARQKAVERDKIVDLLAEKIKKKKEDEDARIAKALEEANVKEKALEREKQRKHKAVLRDMDKWTKIQADEKEKQRVQLMESERLEKEQLDNLAKEFKVKEEEKMASRRKENKLTVEYHKKQLEAQKENARKKKAVESSGTEQLYNEMRKEEEKFQNYAQSLVADSAKKGKNVIPMVKLVEQSKRRQEVFHKLLKSHLGEPVKPPYYS